MLFKSLLGRFCVIRILWQGPNSRESGQNAPNKPQADEQLFHQKSNQNERQSLRELIL